MATDLCFPILKFSYATGVRTDNTIPWTHLSASNVFVIVKGTETNIEDGKLTMRIVQANSVLESLDVARYVDAAIEARRKSEQAGVRPQVEQLPIFGITKESLLAIRYRQEDGQARRLQLRMRNATECRQVIHVFERRGMEFQEQRPRTARPGTARPETAASQSRPLTLNSSSPYFEQPAPAATRPSPFTMPSVEAGSLSQVRSTSPERPPTQNYAPFERPEALSHEMLPPRLFSRDEAAAPREVAPARPTTAQIYRSYTTPSQPSQYNVHEIAKGAPEGPVERPSSTSQMANLEAIQPAAAEHQTPPHSSTHNPPPQAAAPSYSNEHWSSGTVDATNPALLSSDPVEPRPATARLSTPFTIAMPDTLEHEIPPRRELPFGRTESRQTGSEKSGSRPATASMPPLPKPKLVKTGSASPSKSNSASPSKDISPLPPASASPVKRSSVPGGEDPTTSASANRNTADEACPTKTMSPPPRVKSPTSPTKRLSPMDELLARKKPLSERSTNTSVPRLNSLADAPHEIVSPPGTAVSPEKSYADGTTSISPRKRPATENDYTTAIRRTMQHAEKEALKDYAAQSREDREATIDEFMVENLENSSFTKLCEDVENCWRRIALGL